MTVARSRTRQGCADSGRSIFIGTPTMPGPTFVGLIVKYRPGCPFNDITKQLISAFAAYLVTQLLIYSALNKKNLRIMSLAI